MLTVAGGRRRHRDWLRQLEVQHCLCWQLDLLSLGHALDSSTSRSACACPDGRSLAAAGDCADDSPKRRTAANRSRRALTASGTLTVPLVGSDVIALAVEVQRRQFNRELRVTGEMRRGLSLDDASLHVSASRYHHLVFLGDGV